MARPLDVLILDADEKGRETLAYGLRGDGLNATAVATPGEARARLAAGPPDVFLVVLRDAADAVDEELALLQELRTGVPTGTASDKPRLPVVVIGPAPLRPEVQALGDAGFLPLPVFVRDAITATRLLGLRREADAAATPGSETDGSGVVHGTLSDFGMFFLLRTMLALGRTGIAQVERANRRGEVRFIDGDVVAAQVGTLQGQAALHQLLLWEEAALELRFRSVARRGQTFKKGDELLEETERFIRDFAHATKDIGPVASLFVQDPSKAAENLDAIPPEVVPVLRLFDGQRTLGDVLEDSPFRVFDTLRIVSRLMEAAVIRRKAIEKPSGPSRGSRVDEWLNRAPDADLIRGAGTGATPPQASAGDQRVGTGNRRRGPRGPKAKQTGELQTGRLPTKAPQDVAGNTPRPITKPAGGPPQAAGQTPRPITKPAGGPPQAAGQTPRPITKPAGGPPQTVGQTPRPITKPAGGPPQTVGQTPRPITKPAGGPPQTVGQTPRPITRPVGGPRDSAAPAGFPPAGPPTPAPSPAVSGTLRATGTISASTSGELSGLGTPRPSQRTMPAAAEAPSMVIDLSPEEIAAARGPAEDRTPPPITAGQPGPRSTGVHTAELTAPRALSSTEATSSGSSIELSSDLVSEMDAYELATSPPTPPPTLHAPSAQAYAVQAAPPTPLSAGPAPQVAAMAPTPAAIAAPMTPPPATPALPMASALAPPPAQAHAQQPAGDRAAGPGAPPPAPPAGPVVAPRQRTPSVPSLKIRRPSGEFNALEADFFAREADLYKTDATETFDDLADPQGPKAPKGR